MIIGTFVKKKKNRVRPWISQIDPQRSILVKMVPVSGGPPFVFFFAHVGDLRHSQVTFRPTCECRKSVILKILKAPCFSSSFSSSALPPPPFLPLWSQPRWSSPPQEIILAPIFPICPLFFAINSFKSLCHILCIDLLWVGSVGFSDATRPSNL